MCWTNIQGGARNVIPLIVHITHFYYYKSIWHLAHLTSGTFDIWHIWHLAHLTSDTELILIGWKIVPNEEHVQCDHCFASQPLANEPLHSSQLCWCTDTGGTRPLLLQHRTISFKLLAKSVNCLFARSPTLYQSVHENISESLLHSLFVRKTIQPPPFESTVKRTLYAILQTGVLAFSYGQFWLFMASIAFSTNYSIHSHVCNINAMILQF